MNKLKICLLWLLSAFAVGSAGAQNSRVVDVVVTPDHADWLYVCGEEAVFTVRGIRSAVALDDLELTYEYGPEMLRSAQKQGRVRLKNGTATIRCGTMTSPGFLRCKVWAEYDGERYEGLATAAYEPTRIRPTVTEPADFDAFWQSSLQELAAIPISSKMELLPERCTAEVNVYQVCLDNIQGSKMYGILTVPAKAGKYPVMLKVPGAGIRSYAGDVWSARNGIITFEIGIHGIPVTLPETLYEDLGKGALSGYTSIGLNNRQTFYYRRVYLGCSRAVDFLTSLEAFDGKNVAVSGGSQGGALAVVTAALNPKVSVVVSYYPALCDLTGFLHDRAGGWPHYFRDNWAADISGARTTLPYFDVVNFARRLTQPVMFSWGYNDEVCPPTSFYSAYNVVTAPKCVNIVEETGHWTYPEQWHKTDRFIRDHLKAIEQ